MNITFQHNARKNPSVYLYDGERFLGSFNIPNRFLTPGNKLTLEEMKEIILFCEQTNFPEIAAQQYRDYEESVLPVDNYSWSPYLREKVEIEKPAIPSLEELCKDLLHELHCNFAERRREKTNSSSSYD